MALEIGSRLGHYTVDALIGEGGMGQVYQATDIKLNRQVALKILPEAFASDPDRLARFQREAQVLASLNHPGIAAIYGIEDSEGSKALVLELVEGPTLADRIAQGAIPVDEALPIARQIAEALEAAHEQGVIHRDLKPANIKLKPDGTVKVLDFGLAKAMQPDASDPNLSQSPTISLTAAATQMGMVIGTAAYMAPEQASGKPVDKRADVWAFGVVLHEMLTGERLFAGEDVSHTLAYVLTREIDWTALSSDVSEPVRRLIRRCLERDPRRRLRDMGDARIELDEPPMVSQVESVVAPTPRSQVWQRPTVVAGIALAALGIGAITSSSLTDVPSPRVVRFAISLGPDQGFPDIGSFVALSPDGSQVAYPASGLWIRRVDELEAIPVPGVQNGRYPFFSPDGQSLGFYAGGELRRVPVDGGTPTTIVDVPDVPRGVSWGTDDMILYGVSDGIMQVPGVGGTPRLLIETEDDERAHAPQMLPNGEWVLFAVGEAGRSFDEDQIVAQSVSTGERVVVIDQGRDARYLPTGHLVFGLNSVLFAAPFDPDGVRVTAEPVPMVEGVAATDVAGILHYAVSANGALAYVPGMAGGRDDLVLSWVNRAGIAEAMATPPRAYGRSRVSPDGTRIAVDVVEGGNRNIWLWEVEAGVLRQLTFDAAEDNYPIWTTDGTRVVFASNRGGGGIFSKAADGRGQAERIKDGYARPYAWASDGRLVFEQDGDIGVLEMDGSGMSQLLIADPDVREGEPVLSPDGRWLAYYRTNEPGPPTIEVRQFPDVDDGLWNLSLDYGVQPLWSPTGREIFFRGQTDLMMSRVETEPAFSHSTPEPVFPLSPYELGGGAEDARMFDVSPDGNRFIVRASDPNAEPTTFPDLVFVENWFEELKDRVPVD